jgi:cytochrome subunit of sulfide dehydrogenase
MKAPFVLLLPLTLALWLPGAGVADVLAARGAGLAHAWAACHGPDGQSQGAIPSLNGLSAADAIAALQAFRAATRKGTVMLRIAKGLDDAHWRMASCVTAMPRSHKSSCTSR